MSLKHVDTMLCFLTCWCLPTALSAHSLDMSVSANDPPVPQTAGDGRVVIPPGPVSVEELERLFSKEHIRSLTRDQFKQLLSDLHGRLPKYTFWYDHYTWLLEHGYRLRKRYAPDFQGSKDIEDGVKMEYARPRTNMPTIVRPSPRCATQLTLSSDPRSSMLSEYRTASL